MDTGAIHQAVTRFKEANAAHRSAFDRLRDLDLDLRIARRDADGEKQAKLEREKADYASNVWYPARLARTEAVELLCAVLGVSRADLKDAL